VAGGVRPRRLRHRDDLLFAPDAEQDWVLLTPGSLFAPTLWLIASLIFKYYVANFGNFNETYGAIGAVMIRCSGSTSPRSSS
jgi:hypothetical protein